MDPQASPAASQAEAGTRTMRGLLEKGSLTRLMVLRALARGQVRTLRRIADELGISVQAVSEHIKRLQETGLTETTEEGPRLTREGHEALASSLGTIKQYVDQAVRDLAKIETTAARAEKRIEKGDQVGLFMQEGELVARPGSDSPSQGRALQDAEPGQDVLVGGLQGIVDLETGHVLFAIVPDAEQGGSRDVGVEEARRLLHPAGLVATVGPVARHVAEQAGVRPVRFGAAAVAAEAALVGLDVVVLVEASQVEELKRRYEQACAHWGLDPGSTTKLLGPAGERAGDAQGKELLGRSQEPGSGE